LKELVQSYLDIYDMVSLCDIVDGANLSYAWGEACLDLSGTTDVEWAQERNAELMGGNGKFEPALVGSVFPTARIEKKFLWENTIEEKEQRLAQVMLPAELFETRFMLKGKAGEAPTATLHSPPSYDGCELYPRPIQKLLPVVTMVPVLVFPIRAYLSTKAPLLRHRPIVGVYYPRSSGR
jgi:hypothetical protein